MQGYQIRRNEFTKTIFLESILVQSAQKVKEVSYYHSLYWIMVRQSGSI